MSRRCKQGFIQAHLDYTTKHQAPTIFHTWSAIAVIGSVLKRNVWMESSGLPTVPGFFQIFPNLYVVLVSPAGIGMKSTSIKIALELITMSKVQMNILRGAITHTRLISRLRDAVSKSPKQHGNLLVFSREFRVFSKGILRDSPLIDYLTDAYDCDVFDYETEHGMQEQIKQPCINIMAASTPEWLSGGRTGEIMSGGFGARMLPISVLVDERSAAWPGMLELELSLQESLVSDVVAISKMEGCFYVTDNARKFFDEWYQKRHAYRQADLRLSGYYAKKHDQVRKVAMILSASISDDMVVDVQHIQTALKLFAQMEENILFAYTGVASSEKTREQDRVLAKIKEKGAISLADLQLAFRSSLTSRDMKEIISTLIDAETITAESVPTKTRPKWMYKYEKKREEERGGGD